MLKLEKQKKILNDLRLIKLQNPKFELTSNSIYWYLALWGLPKDYSEYVKNNFFKKWIQNFENTPNIDVIWSPDWPAFCQFQNGVLGNDYIKIYLSLDKQNIEEGVNRLFNFLAKENIVHKSKVASKIRADGIIIRIGANDVEALKKINDFINNDSCIQRGKNETNPFIPTIDSIGVMHDDGDSYNNCLSEIIEEYLNSIDLNYPIEINDFIKFASQKFVLKNNIIGYECLSNLYDQNFGIEKFMSDIREQTSITKFPLARAVMTTFDNYSKEQAISALIESTKGKYSGFSRYEKSDIRKTTDLRKIVIDNMNPSEIKQHIYNYTGLDECTAIEVACRIYFELILYQSKGTILDNAIKATALKFNDSSERIEKRITNYMNYGAAENFSSYGLAPNSKVNHRKNVIANIMPSQIVDVVESIVNYNNHFRRNLKSNKIFEYANMVIQELGLKSRRV